MRILLVTSWGNACGIADHSKMLIDAVQYADPTMQIIPAAEALDPVWAAHELAHPTAGIDLIHLNHHDALHARWTPEIVERLTRRGLPVLVTYHDTRATDNSEKLKQFCQVASSVIVHEPVDDVKAIYWRQGVPDAARQPADYTQRTGQYGWHDGENVLWPRPWKAFPQQPVLGTFGFNFPWKQYDDLARITGEEGWALVILSNNATEEDEAKWRALNSSILVIRKFLPQEVAINYLAGCDATAFMYSCANNGTSAAIRYGIAARKPVIALGSCRQFRDLQLLDRPYSTRVGPSGVAWVGDWQAFRAVLQSVTPHPWQAEVTARAHEDSWTKAGQEYAKLYRVLGGAA